MSQVLSMEDFAETPRKRVESKESPSRIKAACTSTLARSRTVFENVFKYMGSKCMEVVGLQLTPGQQIYWNAVQRRMILGMLEDTINGNTRLIHAKKVELPYNLACGLMRDQAIRKYLEKYLEAKKVYIAWPKGRALSVTSMTDSPMDSISPNSLMKIANQDDQMDLRDEEEDIEAMGSFITQGYRAVCSVRDKCKDILHVHGEEREPGPASKPPDNKKQSFNDDEMLLMEDEDDDDDDNVNGDLLNDVIYDSERRGIIRSSSDGITNDDDDDNRFLMIGGRSLKPHFKVIAENTPFLLSNFKFKHVVRNTIFLNTRGSIGMERERNARITKERHRKLRDIWKKVARWPLFTYWLTFVQTLILIITVSVYGFAPYGYFPYTEVTLVQQPSLSVEVKGKDIVPNIWVGPPQSALVLLGANYGPCMRRDRLLYDGIEQDRLFEASQSGCCVRRDGSGCVQVPRIRDCLTIAADFVFYDPLASTVPGTTNRSVCGLAPRTCVSPPSSNPIWQSNSISDWPICTKSVTPVDNVNNSNLHLTCEVTGRPCCYGIQAFCTITSKENCDFLDGRYHEDAFLCSQVDCLSTTCGLTPFARRDHPDQIQRLGLALFLHAGVFHLLISLIFNIIVVRNLEKYHGWLSTSILYLGSGIGGNIVSAIFVPYSPEVGPSAAIFGVISFFWVFIIYHWDIIYNPSWQLVKYCGITLLLLIVGFLPYSDNYAHLGGIVFGTFFSFIHVNYIEKLKLFEEFEQFKNHVEDLRLATTEDLKTKNESNTIMERCKASNRLIFKKALLAVGVVALVALFPVLLICFYEAQGTWNGFTYLNCIIPTRYSDLCQDFAQTIRPRPSVNL